MLADDRVHEVTTADFVSGSWIWPLDKVEEWIERVSEEPIQLASGFCSLKRALTERTDEPEIFQRALPLTMQFLDEVNKLLRSRDLAREQIPVLFGALTTLIGEAGPYRYETKKDETGKIREEVLGPLEKVRLQAVETCKVLFQRPEFLPIDKSLKAELFPLLDAAVEVHGDEHDRFMPFRIIQIGNIAERLLDLAIWLEHDSRHDSRNEQEVGQLVDLLHDLYALKYPRFGTSGLRGRWEVDFTAARAKRTAQAICQYLSAMDIPGYVVPKAKPLTGKWVVIGYDGRRNSPLLAEWLASVALANGFPVQMSSRATPTPAIAFHAVEHLGKENIAGILNCTASHNPSDWQGIKFNPQEGYPAPTHLTDIIAARTNEMQLLDIDAQTADIEVAEDEGRFVYYDPIARYWDWIKHNGEGNMRIPVDFDHIKAYFKEKLVIIDEMHGAGRGYMGHILGELGVPLQLIHTEKDIDLGDLDYANPELPYIRPLMETVKNRGAVLGLGMDTDADRFGVVGKAGEYFRPNQVLAMLVDYLANERELSGRIVITQTGLPMINALAADAPNVDHPDAEAVPPYVDHAFYKPRVGDFEDLREILGAVFVVPVGIKYIEEIRRVLPDYTPIPQSELPPDYRSNVLIGGEESSGLTTRSHVPDKDGLWANLLIMDMIAHYESSPAEIWDRVIRKDNSWPSYGGRVDVDASDRAKERLINYFLDLFKGKEKGEVELAGAPVLYAGGIRYDLVEMFLADDHGKPRNFLRVRASGTEPINRVYTETRDPELWRKLQELVLSKLDEFTIDEIRSAYRIERLADVLTATSPGSWEKVLEAVEEKLNSEGWPKADLVDKLLIKRQHVENRNREVANEWLSYLR